MELAAQKIIGIPIRVDCKEIKGNFKQKKKNQQLFETIFKRLESIKIIKLVRLRCMLVRTDKAAYILYIIFFFINII